MSRRHFYAVFPTETQLLAATRSCREEGFEPFEAFTPHPVHGLDELLGIRRSRLPYATLAGGVAGLGLGLWFQYWSSATDWPLNVGGKPWDSLPAFVPVGFEMLILFAGLVTAGALLWLGRLYPGNRRAPLRPRVSDDHYALLVRCLDSAVSEEELEGIWSAHGAIEHGVEVES